ncbi:AraC family transcriptional regulator [Clostridium chromiireducens]|uniref:AraC family transcriptional regulator n=1 Tax=Clostridium chromiireducens TaxID=225345 RepID=A0A1V4ICN8_9CLOT|nr:AraC family transcriptional regulator [Clostridium chromiireducens]OPJ57624.1 bifunctional transcriptional activator/DNA repair enzyme AdaA [Clostridium chromiireducens]RII34089.1 AraC family transcriptional regulator [Clostridium chromiireducens]
MGKDFIIDENMYGYSLENVGGASVHVEHCFVSGSGSVFPPHWHEQLLLMYIKKGELLLKCREERILAEQDSIAVVNPNEIHSIETLNSDLEYYLIKIDLLLLLGNQSDLQQNIYTEPLLKNRLLFENKINYDDYIFGIMNNIIEEFQEKEEGYELVVRGLACQILIALLRRHKKTVPDQSELDMQYRRLKQIKPAITYMETHMAEKITLVELSEVTHLSPNHFSRVFKIVSGFSPMEYLNRIRVQKAAQLLLNTNKTIVEIAMDTGFNDGNYFSRAFKKCRNETPSEFRERYLRG